MQPTMVKLTSRYRAVNEPLVPVAWHESNRLLADLRPSKHRSHALAHHSGKIYEKDWTAS
jgi:hypothetical protein